MFKPTKLMLPTSHYDKDEADFVINFIQNLKHPKGVWYGKPFLLLGWQEEIIRNLFGIKRPDGVRQFNTAYVEVPKKQGKTTLAAALVLYLLTADEERSAEIYSCAVNRDQASLVYNEVVDMLKLCRPLARRLKINKTGKRVIYDKMSSYYQVLSKERYSKFGMNPHAVIFDEFHAADREMADVMLLGASDARQQPLNFLITTAGNDTKSVGYEYHQKAVDILAGKKQDPTFYPVIYAAEEKDDWTSRETWYKANPSLGVTVPVEKMETACQNALYNPAQENQFRQFRLNQWVKQSVRWMQMHVWDRCNSPVDAKNLEGRVCYGGLDLASISDVAAFVLVFPPETEEDRYEILPYFWIPKANMAERVRRDGVLYDLWHRQKHLIATEGNVIHYGFIEKFITDLHQKYNIKEIAYDRWQAIQMAQNLEDIGITMVPFGQGYRSMTWPTKELMKLTLEGKLAHGAHPVLRWMMDNVHVKTDPAGNIKPDKEKSSEKIDGVVALIMALDRALRHRQEDTKSVYDNRGLLVLGGEG